MNTPKLFTLLALLTASGSALAQTDCPAPALKVLRGNQEVPATGGPLAPNVTLRLVPNAQCAGTVYQFTQAELTLVRGRRPLLPTLLAAEANVDLSALMSQYQPGDRLYVFIPYKNLRVVGADGNARPYPMPTLPSATTENGIGFNWPLSR